MSVPALPNLCKDLKVALTETYAALPEVGSLSSYVFLPDGVVCFLSSGRGLGVFGFEVIETGLASTNISQKIEIVVEKICRLLAKLLWQNPHDILLTELSNVGKPLHIWFL